MFEDSQMNLETRFRNHLKSSASDSDFSEPSNHSRSTASFLSSRGLRADEHFTDNMKPAPLAAPGFLKDSTESSYLSITPKVMLGRRTYNNLFDGMKSSCGSQISQQRSQLGWFRYKNLSQNSCNLAPSSRSFHFL